MFAGVFGSNTAKVNKPVTLNANKAANVAVNAAKNASVAAVNAAGVASVNLKNVGTQLQNAAAVLDKNSNTLAEIVATAVDELKKTKTGNAMVQAGGARASFLAAMPRSVISGGARRFIRDAARTLKQLGGNVNKAGKVLPNVVASVANKAANVVNATATNKNLAKLNAGLNNAAAAVSNGANAANASLGTNLPSNLNVAPVNLSVASNAKNAANTVVNAANNMRVNVSKKNGNSFNMTMMSKNSKNNKNKKGGKKSSKKNTRKTRKMKRGGFFRRPIPPVNPRPTNSAAGAARAASVAARAPAVNRPMTTPRA